MQPATHHVALYHSQNHRQHISIIRNINQYSTKPYNKNTNFRTKYRSFAYYADLQKPDSWIMDDQFAYLWRACLNKATNRLSLISRTFFTTKFEHFCSLIKNENSGKKHLCILLPVLFFNLFSSLFAPEEARTDFDARFSWGSYFVNETLHSTCSAVTPQIDFGYRFSTIA